MQRRPGCGFYFKSSPGQQAAGGSAQGRPGAAFAGILPAPFWGLVTAPLKLTIAMCSSFSPQTSYPPSPGLLLSLTLTLGYLPIDL